MGELHNELRHGSRLSVGIKRLLGMDGDQEGTSRVSETLTPVMDPWSRPEFALHRGELLAWHGVDQAAVAGQTSKTQVKNPAGSRVLFVVSGVWIRVTAAATVGFFLGVNPDLATLDAGFGMRDMRGIQPRTRTLLRHETSAAAATGNQWRQVFLPNTASLYVPLNIILEPGGADLGVACLVANVGFQAWYDGYERLLFQGEGRQ